MKSPIIGFIGVIIVFIILGIHLLIDEIKNNGKK